MPLAQQEQRTGTITCQHCFGEFEATAFAAPESAEPVVAQVMEVGPDGANACANHARNAAVTSCQRCGLFICALCDMNVGAGSYCPACFERMRAEGTMQTAAKRYRDHAGMAISSSIFGLLLWGCLGAPLGALTIYYANKGRAQRRMEGRSTAGMIVAMSIGALLAASWLVFVGVVIYRSATS